MAVVMSSALLNSAWKSRRIEAGVTPGPRCHLARTEKARLVRSSSPKSEGGREGRPT